MIVVQNRSQQTAYVTVGPVWGQTRQFALAPGKLIRVAAAGTVPLGVTAPGQPAQFQVEPNTVGYLEEGAGRWRLTPAEFVHARPSVWVRAGAAGEAPASITIPVKILTDEEQAAARPVWEARLRGQIAALSGFLDVYCGVRLDVVAVETWSSDNAQSDLARLEDDFRRKVVPDPAWLAIGFTSQLHVSKNRPLRHLPRDPLFTHLLLPDVQTEFSALAQLELLAHELGHFLGAAHSGDENSLMRTSLRDEKTVMRGAGDMYDAPNTLVMNLVADEIRSRQARTLGQISRETREYLRAIYLDMARAFPRDREAQRYADLVRHPVEPVERFTGLWVDGTRRTAGEVLAWHEPGASPTLAGKPLLDPQVPIRWLEDTTLQAAKPPKAMVEMVGGDCLPGRVVAVHSGTEPGEALPPYVEVVPDVPLDWAEGPSRPRLRVSTQWVRRLVWQRMTERYRPATLWLVDGRQIAFRSVRLEPAEVRVLREDGIRAIPWVDVAELHMPASDPWNAYVEQLAALGADSQSRLMFLETSDGLRATTSLERLRPRAHGPGDRPSSWYHAIQPAWSLDVLWVQHRRVRLRVWFRPEEVPLSRIDPQRAEQHSVLGGVWPWQVDRNVQQGPLESGGRRYGWGLGVHGSCELEFPLPPLARAFSTRLGLDHLAGSGGCVRAAVLCGHSTLTTLVADRLIMGSQEVVDTGRLAIPDTSGQAGRLILRVDSALDQRPPVADPLDIRDLFDWLEPLVELDPARLHQEVLRCGPRVVPAWRDWEVAWGHQSSVAPLAVFCDQPDSRSPQFCLATRTGTTPLALSARVRIGPETDQLRLWVSRPPGSPASRIEVLVEGLSAARFEVPVRHASQTPEPLCVSLTPYQDRETAIQIVQQGQDDRALVQWRAIRLCGAPSAALRAYPKWGLTPLQPTETTHNVGASHARQRGSVPLWERLK